jgi:hypothetical protein
MKRDDKFDLEGELHASRPRPRGDFARALAEEVRSRPTERTRLGRAGLALALSGLIMVALASFGGIGYASSAASHAVKKQAVAQHVRIVSHSAAQAQYTSPVTPKAKPKPTKNPTATALGQTKAQGAAPTVTSSQLPFTGLTLWVPLAIGLALLAFGLVLRTRARGRGSSAH